MALLYYGDKMADIFVFGSNLQGRHGRGSAKFAVDNHGAIYGVGRGIQGNSYGIPTKSNPWQTLSLPRIMVYVNEFKEWVLDHPNDSFRVVEIGCGLAGYTPQEIAPLFKDMPKNVYLPDSFRKILERKET